MVSLDSKPSRLQIPTLSSVMKCPRMMLERVKNIGEIIRGSCHAAPITDKIHQRHLELEPLCCMSSCLVRGGCYAVVVFEILYVVATLFVVAFKIYDGGRMKFWDELEPNFNALVTHHFSLYILCIFDLFTLVMATALLRGLVGFDRSLVKLHWRSDFVALGFNAFALFSYLFALSSEGPETWTGENILLVFAFAGQLPLQLWAVTVVKSCHDFFVLLHVFIALAEK